ncbi:MAG: hypothetical protein EA391_01645 [Balneolaceae bacterium]|nr:MAG: hypothetical protein EA391_01645 [Balneolaceae bacterium]
MRFTLFVFSLLFVVDSVFAQSSFSNSDEYYFRVLQISGITDDISSFQLRPYNPPQQIDNDHPWSHVFGNQPDDLQIGGRYGAFQLYEPILFQSFNTALPRGNNDGAIWQGKGYNSALSLGFEASIGPLYLQFRPMVGFTQNRAFDLGPYQPPMIRGADGNREASIYAYRDFRGSIDFVQRYGDDTFSWFDLGESSLELRYAGLKIAASNKQIWTGPGTHTSLQFGYSAPGFRHIYLGSYKPLKTFAGSFEFAYIFGGMRKSDYFDGRTESRLQSVNSLIIIYSPWFSDNFHIGGVRTYFHPFPKSMGQFREQAGKLFDPGLRSNLSDGDDFAATWDPDNQVGSIFLRYFIPQYGVEFYTEYGRNDHNADWRDFRAHPNHQRAYTLGMLKTMNLSKDRLLAINLEITQQETNRTSLTRGGQHLGGWYTHGAQVQGFTNRGQILGTGYGPGMNMQMLQTDIYDKRGSLSLRAARITYHNSRVDQFFENIRAANGHSFAPWEVRNIELLIGTSITAFLNHGIEVSATIDQSYILNHHNLNGNDILNTRFELIIRKQMSGWLR